MFPNQFALDAAQPAWEKIPAAAGVFALFPHDPRAESAVRGEPVFGGGEPGVSGEPGARAAEPYISRTPNLRRRIRRLLDAQPGQTKRLQLAGRVARIEYARTGSDFESLLRLYQACRSAFGDRARKRLHLRPPFLLRMTSENAYPRVYVTNKVTKSGMDDLYGPFPSRAAAETFLEEMLDLFKLRRCYEDLAPDPAFPGCVYSEMKKCLAPCFQGCTDERYQEEAAAVRNFLRTRGASLVQSLAHEREQASELMEFEKAAELHARLARAEAVAAKLSEAMRPLSQLNAAIVQPAAEPAHVALFLLAEGRLRGPALYSVAGMRHANEAAGSTSLFAHPVSAPEAVPLDAPVVTATTRDELEQRLESVLAELNAAPQRRKRAAGGSDETADHLCLFSRWYHRPLAKRVGEIIFAPQDGAIPRKPLLRAISRVYQKQSPASREVAEATPPQHS